MIMRLSPCGVLPLLLAMAAPQLFGQHKQPRRPSAVVDEMQRFTLSETPAQLRSILGEPKLIVDLNDKFRSFQYQVDSHDPHDFSHIVCIRRTDGVIISITRNYEEPREVETLMPARETTTHYYPDAAKPEYSARARSLARGQRFLLAMGTSKPGDKTSQLVMVRREVLPDFFAWIVPPPAVAAVAVSPRSRTSAAAGLRTSPN